MKKQKRTEKPFLTLYEASEYLGLARSTLYSYVRKKTLPYYKPNGRIVYFKLEDLNNFVLNESSHYRSQDEIKKQAFREHLDNNEERES